jgi:hypothetical protein
VWNIKRDENTKGATWSTPYVWESELRTELVTSSSGKVRSYDLTGKLLWKLSGMRFLTAPSKKREGTTASRCPRLSLSSPYQTGGWSYQKGHVNGDVDLVCQVYTSQLMVAGTGIAVLEARTFDGRLVRGQGRITIVPQHPTGRLLIRSAAGSATLGT